MTVELGQVPKVTGESSKKEVACLLPNLTNQSVKGEADEKVHEKAGIHLKQTMLGQR